MAVKRVLNCQISIKKFKIESALTKIVLHNVDFVCYTRHVVIKTVVIQNAVLAVSYNGRSLYEDGDRLH